MKEIHIHPHYEKYYFLDADADGSEVEFEIEDFWETGLEQPIRVAKLIRPNEQSEALDFLAEQAQELDMGYDETICEYSGLPAVTEYIGDDMDSDKIEGILDRALAEQTTYTEAQVRMAIQKARVTNTQNLIGTGLKLHRWSDDEILKLIKTKL
jgi:hypothetical protein